MYKRQCEREKLLKALTISSRLVSSRIGLPILQNIYLEVKNKTLTVCSTNLDSSIQFDIEVKNEDKGSLTVPAKTMLDYLYNNNDELITLDSVDTNLKVESSTHKASLKGISAQDYPSLPDATLSYKLPFSVNELEKAISYTAFAAATDETRPVLTGLLWKFKDKKLQIVATDGFRLALYETESPEDITEDYIIPKKSIQEVQKIFEEKDVEIGFSPTQVVFKGDGANFTSRLIDGSFPNFEAIIPKTKNIEITTKSSDLQKALRIACLFSRDSAYTTSLILEGNNLEINAVSPQLGETSNKVVVDNPSNQPFKISVNAQYLIDVLSVLGDEVCISFIDQKSPIVVTIPKKSYFTYLVMPLRTT